MAQLSAVIQDFGYFVRARFGSGNVIQKQKGIFRTNCIDCLDRTNLMQAKLAMQYVEKILKYISSEN